MLDKIKAWFRTVNKRKLTAAGLIFLVLMIALIVVFYIRPSADVVNSARPEILPIAEKSYRAGEFLNLPIYVLDEDETDMSQVQVLVDWGDGSQVLDQAAYHRAITTKWAGKPTMRILAPHRYQSIGELTATITVVDSTGTNSLPYSFKVRVYGEVDTGSVNYSPTIVRVTDGDMVTSSVEFPFYVELADYSDINGEHSIGIDWGDGTSEIKTPGPHPLATVGNKVAVFNKKYERPGAYIATVTVTDGLQYSTTDKYLIVVTAGMEYWAADISITSTEPQGRVVQPTIVIAEHNAYQPITSAVVTWDAQEGGEPGQDLLQHDDSVGNLQYNVLGGVYNSEAGVYMLKSRYLMARPRHEYLRDGVKRLRVSISENPNGVDSKEVEIPIGEITRTEDQISPPVGTPIKRNTTAIFTFRANSQLQSDEYMGLQVRYSDSERGGFSRPILNLLPDSEQPAGFDRSKLKFQTSTYQGREVYYEIFIPEGMAVSFSVDVSNPRPGGNYRELQVVATKTANPVDVVSGTTHRFTASRRGDPKYYSYTIVDNDNSYLMPVSGTTLERGQDNVFTFNTRDATDSIIFIFRVWAPKWDANSNSYVPTLLELLPPSEDNQYDPSKVHPLDFAATSDGQTRSSVQGFTVDPGTVFKFKSSLGINPNNLFGGRQLEDFSALDVDIYMRTGNSGRLLEANRYTIAGTAANPDTGTGTGTDGDSGETDADDSADAGQTTGDESEEETTAEQSTGQESTQQLASQSTEDQQQQQAVAEQAAEQAKVDETIQQVEVEQARGRVVATRTRVVAAERQLKQAQETDAPRSAVNEAKKELREARGEYKEAKQDFKTTERTIAEATGAEVAPLGFWARIGQFFNNIWSAITGWFS